VAPIIFPTFQLFPSGLAAEIDLNRRGKPQLVPHTAGIESAKALTVNFGSDKHQLTAVSALVEQRTVNSLRHGVVQTLIADANVEAGTGPGNIGGISLHAIVTPDSIHNRRVITTIL
jgi:hypothetical protein